MSSTSKFSLLGPVSVRIGDREVLLGGTRTQAVLATLLLEANRVVPLDSIVDAAWGEEPPTTARIQSQNRISTLRRALREAGGADVIDTVGAGYLIRVAPGRLDLDEFESHVQDANRLAADDRPTAAADVLAAALELWRGPALFGLNTVRLLAAATRLEEARLAAKELLIDLQLRCGHHHEVIGDLVALVAAHPWRERPAAQLILALHRAGRRREALDVFDRTSALLRSELGLDPGLDLIRLRERVLRDDPAEPVPIPPTPLRSTRRAKGTGTGTEWKVSGPTSSI